MEEDGHASLRGKMREEKRFTVGLKRENANSFSAFSLTSQVIVVKRTKGNVEILELFRWDFRTDNADKREPRGKEMYKTQTQEHHVKDAEEHL